MRSSGLLVTFLGKSIFSMPFRMKVYVVIWSFPENGGLAGKDEKHGNVTPADVHRGGLLESSDDYT